MAGDLRALVESTKLGAEDITARTRHIYDATLRESLNLDSGNFTRIHTSDVKHLFDEYDTRFFEAQIGTSLGDTALHFRLSRRMTKAGGKTARYTPRNPAARPVYEISVSTTLLFQCFAGDDHRPIAVGGIICRDRLEALQRVTEHEIVHLIELLLWATSSCSETRFHSVARRFFGHTAHKHELITPGERAFVRFGIKPGDRVRFRFHGAQRTGVVNRITDRATVLVEDREGTLFSDGKRYVKFYVPVALLEAVEADRSKENE